MHADPPIPLRSLSVRWRADAIPPAAVAWALPFPVAWRDALIADGLLDDSEIERSLSLNQALRALAPGLIAVNDDALCSDGPRCAARPWLVAAHAVPLALLRLITAAWIDAAFPMLSDAARRTAKMGVFDGEPVWRACRVDGRRVAPAAPLLPDDWHAWARLHALASALTHERMRFDACGATFQFYATPSRGGCVDLISWPPVMTERNGSAVWASFAVSLTVPWHSLPSSSTMQCTIGAIRWISAPSIRPAAPFARCRVVLIPREAWHAADRAARSWRTLEARRTNGRFAWDDVLSAMLSARPALGRALPDPDRVLTDPLAALRASAGWRAAATPWTRSVFDDDAVALLEPASDALAEQIVERMQPWITVAMR